MRQRTARRTLATLILVAATSLVFASPLSSAAAGQPSHPGALKVLTRNLYVGGALERIFATTTPQEAIESATVIWGTVQATDFPERAETIAGEIAAHHPHLVGLQEAAIWTSRDLLLPTPPDPTVEFDFLQILLDELGARGLKYEAVASVTNLVAEVPVIDPMSPSGLKLVGLVDRDVMLARSDLPAHVFEVTNPDGANFDAALSFIGPLGPVVVPRGWVAVDATLRGTTVRVVNAHLERVAPLVQEAQGAELLAGPADTALPVLIMGDLNSAAGAGGVPGQSDTSTYDDLIDAGFVDAWSEERLGPGFSCCHAEDLRNAVAFLTERIDVVLVRGLRPRSATLLGARLEDRTSSGLWPSDHAGVAAVVGPL